MSPSHLKRNFRNYARMLALSLVGYSFAELQAQLPSVELPANSPSPITLSPDSSDASSLNLGAQTNLISLQEIRNLSNSGDLEKAQAATEALSQINETEETKFYLRQIRKEETKLYFDRANQAMVIKIIHSPVAY